MPGRDLYRQWRTPIGILLSAGCLVWLATTTDWRETWRALLQARLWLIGAAVLLNLATIPMRALRWQLIFPSPRPPLKSLTTAMLIGQAVNVVTPARLGDLVRASLVEEKSTGFTLGTMVIQTALDLIMSATLVILILFQLTLPQEWQNSGRIVIGTAVMATALVVLTVFGRHFFIRVMEGMRLRWPRLPLQRPFRVGIDLLQSFDAVQNPLVMLGSLLWSVAIWSVYGLTNYVLLLALTPDATLLAAYLVLVVLQLGISIPSSPGRVGVYHILGQRALEVAGQNSSVALTFAFILHLISLIMPATIGAVLAWQRGVSLRSRPAAVPAE